MARADRSRRALVLGLWSAMATLLLASRAANADEPVPPIHVRTTETVHDGCPRSPSMLERLKVRSERIEGAPEDEGAVRVDVDVRRDGAWSRGELSLVFDGERTTRTAEALSCEEVLAALAAMAVVALDTLPEREGARAQAKDEPRRASLTVAQTPSIRAPSVAPRRRIAFGGGLAVRILGHDPTVVSRGLFIEARIESRREDWVTRLEPSVRLDVSRSTHAEVATARGRASLVWTTADLRACVDLVRTGGLSLGPCASGAFGQLEAQAFAPATPTSRARPWITVGALARVRFRPLRALSVEADLGVTRPLVRDAIFFEPGSLIYVTPALVPTAGLAVMAELP